MSRRRRDGTTPNWGTPNPITGENDQWPGLSQIETADALGVSSEAVRQVERRAIRKLWRRGLRGSR